MSKLGSVVLPIHWLLKIIVL